MSTLLDIKLKLLKNKTKNVLTLGPSNKIDYEIKLTCQCGNSSHLTIQEKDGKIVVEKDE